MSRPTNAQLHDADLLQWIVCNACGVVFVAGLVITALRGGIHVFS